MKIGIVVAIDSAKCAARVQFADSDGMISFWLPVVQPKTLKDRFYHMPDINEHVVCLLDENGEAGVILGAIYSDADKPPVTSKDKWHVTFEDGTALEYDRAGHKLFADVKGDIEVIASGTLTASIAGDSTITTPTCTLNGNLVINGTAQVSGNITGGANIQAAANVADQGGAKTMAGMRQVFNQHTHPENGTGGGTTSQPNQGM